MRAVVVANGKLDDDTRTVPEIGPDDLVICADGGVQNALALGVTPGVLLGDFDSASQAAVRQAETRGAKPIRFPAHKDETDAELALRYAVAAGATEILFLGALGGRLDHALANLFLLAAPEFAGVRIRIVDGSTSLELCRGQCEIRGRVGDIVSLLPLTGAARGVVTHGLEYPLKGETLEFGPARGVSNVMLADVAWVSIESGMLVVIHTVAENGG